MDLLLMGLLAAAAGAGVGYATGRGRRVQSARRVAAEAALETRFVALSERLAKEHEALEWRFCGIDAALGRHSDYGQELRDGLEAVKGDLDRRLHLFDVDLNTATGRLDAMGAAVNEQWAQELENLRTLLEEEGERVKELAVLQRVQGSAVQTLRDCTVGREELEKLQAQLDEVSPALVVRFQAMLDQQVLLLRDRTVGREELEKLQPQLDYLRDCTVSRKEMAQLQAVVERLEKATGNVTGNAGRIEALELAQGIGDGRLAQLEQRLAEATSHMANLAQDTLSAIGELKSELAGELETMGDRVEKVDADQQQLLELLERRLGEVQDFIIKAADDAKARREGLQSSPLPPVGGVAELLQQQQALQQAFRQRRPAVAAVFPTVPREVGL